MAYICEGMSSRRRKKNNIKKQKQKKEKWVKHYSSNHQILLVGEGDFSFSLSLARSFGSASNMLASSLDSYGFYGKESNADVIKMHRDLVNGFFRNASCMLLADGEIHVNHKTTAPFCYWNIHELASYNSMALVECLDFKKEDYPGYKNKRGSGSKCDKSFPLGKCSTLKFKFQETMIQMQQCSTSTYFSYPREGHLSNMEQIWGRAPLPLPTNPRNQFLGILPLPLPTRRCNYNLSYSLDTPGIHPVSGEWE